MSQTKYFYIITRDGQIFEIEYSEQRIAMAVQTMRDKGLFTIKEGGMVINGADISKVLNDEQYENYVSTVRPKEYVVDGTWYDGKEHKFMRNEKWKQLLIDEKDKEMMMRIGDGNKYEEEPTMTAEEFRKKYPNLPILNICQK